jgi:hypothetical protein
MLVAPRNSRTAPVRPAMRPRTFIKFGARRRRAIIGEDCPFDNMRACRRYY